MTSFATPDGVDVAVESDTLVVTIEAGVSLDRLDAKRVNRTFMHLLREQEVVACLTVLHSTSPLTDGAFEAVERAAAAAIANDVARWGVVDECETGLTFSERIAGIDTRLFEDRETALAWTNDA